ncbi:unnamed protein product [Urochloa humidicola]
MGTPPREPAAAPSHVDHHNETGPRSHKRRRRSKNKKNLDPPSGSDSDHISALPNEILLAILEDLDAKTVVTTSILSRRWRRLWASLRSLRFSEVSLPSDSSWVRFGPMRKEYVKANKFYHFVPSMLWFSEMVKKRSDTAAGDGGDAALTRLSIVFSGSAECTYAVNAAIASAAKHGVKHIDVAVVGDTRRSYEFPSWHFSESDGDTNNNNTCSSSSLDSLCLNNCKLTIPNGFKGFSSLTKLVLVATRTSAKDDQGDLLLLGSCENLKILYLIDMPDVRVLRHRKLEELVWLWPPHPRPWLESDAALKIDAPVLRRLEYCGAGEVLPASTRRSLPCLEHVSLQHVVYGELPDRHAENLRTIATRFPHVKSLHLRYRVPKLVVRPRMLAIFSKLRVLTLSIETKPSDDLLWMAMFVVAAPCLEILQTNVRYLPFLESPNGVVWDGSSNFEHNSLREVEMYNFKGRDNEIAFARLLLRSAPSMRRIAFRQGRLREAENQYRSILPPDWPKAKEFNPRNNQLVLSKLMDGVSSGARVVFM